MIKCKAEYLLVHSPTSGSNSSSDMSMSSGNSRDCYSSALGDEGRSFSPDSTVPGSNSDKPFLKIVEEPGNQFRFRYKSEMQGTHGAIQGATASKGEKKHPSVMLCNFKGEAVIRCTLYTADDEKKRSPHVHRLVGKSTGKEKDDPHDLPVGLPVGPNLKSGYTACFHNLVIIHTAKKQLVDELLEKKIRLIKANFPESHILDIHENVKTKMRIEAEAESKGMNMNSVCLRFDALKRVDKRLVEICDPVYTQSINNMKSHVTGQLRISRIDKFTSSCEGDEEIFLLVEKVGKNNIRVVFSECDESGNEIWHDYGTQIDVHHQYAIVCKSPKYRSTDIRQNVIVKMQLERISDGSRSEPREFIYKPIEYDRITNLGKRRRVDSSCRSPLQQPDTTFTEAVGQNTCGEMLSNKIEIDADPVNTLISHDRNPLMTGVQSCDIGLDDNSILRFESEEFPNSCDDYIMMDDTEMDGSLPGSLLLLHDDMIEQSAASFSNEFKKLPEPPTELVKCIYNSAEIRDAIGDEVIDGNRPDFITDLLYDCNIPNVQIQSAPPVLAHPSVRGYNLVTDGTPARAKLKLNTFNSKTIKKVQLSDVPEVKSFAPTVKNFAKINLVKNFVPKGKSFVCEAQMTPQMTAGSQLKNSKEETTDKRKGLRAVQFAKRTLHRLQQLLDTAWFPDVTKADIQKKFNEELNLGTRRGDTVLHTAIKYKQLKELFQLLVIIKKQYGDISRIVNRPNAITKVSPLHLAVVIIDSEESVTVVKRLLELGADPNQVDDKERTPLHFAVKANKNKDVCTYPVVKCLLETAGIMVNAVSADDGTALHIAAEYNLTDIAELLIRHGACVNSIDNKTGRTPLHVAVKRSNLEILNILLSQQAIDVNKEDYNRQTPLKFAKRNSDVRILKIITKLIDHGAQWSHSGSISDNTDDTMSSNDEAYDGKRSQMLADILQKMTVDNPIELEESIILIKEEDES